MDFQTNISGNAEGCDKVTLTANGGISYKWNGGETPNSDTNTFLTSGIYTVEITNAGGCIKLLQQEIKVNPPAIANASISASSTIFCENTRVTFTSTYSNAGTNPSFKWFKNNTQVATTETYSTSAIDNNDEIYCQITGSSLCSVPVNSNKIVMKVAEKPTVSFSGDIVIEKNGPITLEPVVTGNIASYSWFPSNGLDNSTIKNPKANPENSGTYTLKVISDAGCEATATVKIIVLKDVVIPNVFSPNGDNKNDTWLIKNVRDYIGSKLVVYGRHGNLVYQTETFDKPWDGNYQGKPVPVGVYYYILYLKNKDNTMYKGSVTLLR